MIKSQHPQFFQLEPLFSSATCYKVVPFVLVLLLPELTGIFDASSVATQTNMSFTFNPVFADVSQYTSFFSQTNALMSSSVTAGSETSALLPTRTRMAFESIQLYTSLIQQFLTSLKESMLVRSKMRKTACESIYFEKYFYSRY